MSNAALKAAVTGTDVTKSNGKPTTLIELLSSDKTKHQLAAALPKHMTADRMARVIMTELRKVPKLAACDPHSFMGAVMMASQVGLEPGGALGHCYLIPFENRRANRVEVQFIMGYRGMLDLARRSGQIISIEARSVYESDKFHVSFGLEPDLKHEPAWELADRGELRAVYAVAKLKDGGTQFEVMSRADVERVRNESQGYKTAKRFQKDGVINSPWATHFEEMAKKTVLRRLFKWLPMSIEMAKAVEADERTDAGKPVEYIDAETGEFFSTGADYGEDDGGSSGSDAGTDGDEGMTYAQVADRIHSASDVDALDMARDLIRAVPSEQQQSELHQLAAKRLEAISKT